MISLSKEKLLAQIDQAFGGMVAEEIILTDGEEYSTEHISSGCGSDLSKATNLARRAVREFGMFGEEGSSFISSQKDDTSNKMNSAIDLKVKQILDESHERVLKLLKKHKSKIKDLAENLYSYDYLDEDEIKNILEGNKIKKEPLRKWPQDEQALF